MLIKKNHIYIFISLRLSFYFSFFIINSFCNILLVKLLHHKTLRILQKCGMHFPCSWKIYVPQIFQISLIFSSSTLYIKLFFVEAEVHNLQSTYSSDLIIYNKFNDNP